MSVDPVFWTDRRVLVTGHTGFKGVWLCAWLCELGAEVTGYALPPTHARPLFDAAGLDFRMTSHIGDIRDGEWLEALVRRSRPEIVFHLAARSIVLDALREPADTFAVNIMGTVALLEALRAAPDLRAVVVVTSDKVYADPARLCREDAPLGSREPYGASKACAEHVVAAYRHCYLTADDGIGLATARAGNVIGGGDFSPDRLLPDIVRAARAGRPVILRHPEHRRPWQHVLEALHGYLLLAQALTREPSTFAGAWNFGPQPGCADLSVRELTALALEALGGGEIEILEGEKDGIEWPIQRLSPARARARLGWQPPLTPRERVEWTIAGYRALAGGESGWLPAQIGAYLERVRELPAAGEERIHAVA